MQAVKMLHQELNESCPEIHAYRLTALMAGVEALVTGQTLTVTGLGRALRRNIRGQVFHCHIDTVCIILA